MTLSGVAIRAPDGRPLLDNLNLAFGRERTGLVGRNGVGKTTLLRLLAGFDTPAEGVVGRTGSVGWLAQTREPSPGQTIADVLGVSEAWAATRRVLAGEGGAADFDIADWALEERIGQALDDAGLGSVDPDRTVDGLSGGERTRLELARLDLERPDLLLLDEPTNHLDAGARAALRGLIARWPGGVVAVSHDRELLRGMDRIVELSTPRAAVYGGGYDLYAERKAAERSAAERDLEAVERAVGQAARENQRATEKKARRDSAGRAFAAKGGTPRILLGAMAERAELSGARETGLAKRRAEAAEADLADARERIERVRRLSIPMPSTGLAAGREALAMEQVGWRTAEGRLVLDGVSLRLTGPERLVVTGPNGAGKSTLLRLAAGELEPSAGRIERPVAGVMLDQDASALRPDETLVEGYLRLNLEATPNLARAALARFLFRNTAADRRAGSLSGGERLRAALACVMTGARPPQLLILDEPTNHLDLDSIEAVEAALQAYDGALIVVSHDADFLTSIGCDRRLELIQPQASTTPLRRAVDDAGGV